MSRITTPLTNTEVKQAKPKEKAYNLSDGNGLALRVKPNGSKLWLLDYYRPHTKKRTSLSFGTYPEVSLAEARREREKARALLAKSIDPKEHRDQQKQRQIEAHQNTFLHIASLWFEVKKADVTSDYAIDIWRSLELHIFPTLGPIPIHTLTAPKTIDVIRPIAAKGSLETVKRLCQRVNEIMIFAVNTGVIESNPLAGIKKAFEAPKKKHMPTIKPEQLQGLMQNLSTASIKKTTRALIEWQLHTMTRPSEAAGTRWDEIDFTTGLWNIPAERMKKKKEHCIPLSAQAIGLLEAMKPISGHREYVFPADRDPTRHANEQTANAALKRMGFNGILVAHGLRALASTTLNENGFDPDVIEAALAHVDKNEVRRAYNRADYLERRKALMCWWSEHIEKAATGNMSLAGGSQRLSVVSS